MRHAELLFGVAGQAFAFDAPEGRPTAPSVQVFRWDADDDGTPELATTGSATVDGVNTTLALAALGGTKSLTLDSGAFVERGRRYLLTSAAGEREVVEVSGIVGAVAQLRHPIVNDYDPGSTVQGTRISIGVDPVWVADRDNITDVLESALRDSIRVRGERPPGAAGYRLRWTYTVDGAPTVAVSYADLVRYRAQNLCSALDVDRRFPGWIDRLPPDYRDDQGAALVAEAHRAVLFDAMGDGHVLRQIRDTQVLTELVVYRSNLMAIEAHVMAGAERGDAATAARDLYERRYKQLIREPKVAVDAGGGGGGAPAQRLPLWRR